MYSIATWNFRGLNRIPKQKDLRKVIVENHLNVCGILESHVDIGKLERVCSKVCVKWSWSSNGSLCSKGSRIILGWNTDYVDVMVLSCSKQAMHTQVILKADQKMLFCSFIYADNYYKNRRELWSELEMHAGFVRGKSWAIMRDFNSALYLEDTYCSSSEINISMREFKECVSNIEMTDMNYIGLRFTWNQKPKAANGMLKKIDRVMANMEFANEFPGAYDVFQPCRISDHAPAVLKLQKLSKDKPKPFKFANFLVHKPEFKEIVAKEWLTHMDGYNMFKVVKRMRFLKKPLRKLLVKQGNLHERVTKLRHELDVVQKALDLDPSSLVLHEEEALYLKYFNQALLDEERYLKQKAKVEWLRVGDTNSSYFHRMVKSRVARSRIDCVVGMDNGINEGSAVPHAFVKHYMEFLGVEEAVTPIVWNGLFSKRIDHAKAEIMIRTVTNLEVQSAMFSIGENKAPGPDGFTSSFFKKIMGHSGLLQEINHTILSLLPKVSSPTRINDYRPISCCNVIYKVISKIITNRIKEGLHDIVSDNQSAFVPGRSISDNILITQELMNNYHLNKGPPRCAFKIDIQKAYDTVNWNFLKDILVGFGFHLTMIGWIMACVTSTSFSLCVNGELHGYFKGRRGLRKGDPISPYLFTLVMEILTLMLKRRVQNVEDFEYHNRCHKQKIVSVCFAYDLIMFARGDVASARVLMEALDEFKCASGLVPSIPKSTAFFCNVVNHVKATILQLMPLEEGTLPIVYLGVPLISSRLLYRDCKVLVERVQKRIHDWKNRYLFFAGRLQLVLSILSLLHGYWASVFIFLAAIIHDIEQLMCGFLWCQGDMKQGKAKVSWDSVCLPKEEGGLGIRRLESFNIALMASHVWKIITCKESMWVKWIHSYKQKGRDFWDVQPHSNISWGWRKILQIRKHIRPFFWVRIGDGCNTSVWFDKWNANCPLMDHVTSRMVSNAGFKLNDRVADIVRHGTWSWPLSWFARAPILYQVPCPVLTHGLQDKVFWRMQDGKMKEFSISSAWDSIRARSDTVPWFRVVWLSTCIPRHAFHLWLVMRKKLKTQDKLKKWDVGNYVDLNLLRCPLCKTQSDSHEHLFFECAYASQVWSRICDMENFPNTCPIWEDIISWILPISNGNSVTSIVGRLLIAASSYLVWQERNNRLFGKGERRVEHLCEVIVEVVWLKLSTIHFKSNSRVDKMRAVWKIGIPCSD